MSPTATLATTAKVTASVSSSDVPAAPAISTAAAAAAAATSMARPPEDELSTVQAFHARILANRQHAAEEKLRRVNRVLHRAKVSKIANALRKRLEYASFKVRHGCADKTLAEVKQLFAAATSSTTPAPAPNHLSFTGAIPPHDLYHRQSSSSSCSFPSASSSLPYPVSPVSSTPDKSDLAASLTCKLRAETDAYFARLGHPPVAKHPLWSTSSPLATAASSLSKSSSHFPSPAPSPVSSRASSPLGKASAGAADSIAEPAYPPDPDAEQGARLLMMMLGK
ncbi:hypothetical protein HDU86_006710 [Geranomyces michiganensis]|nr:hypothetical protein HDU86_006710 [Geranomyces michiganensis]